MSEQDCKSLTHYLLLNCFIKKHIDSKGNEVHGNEKQCEKAMSQFEMFCIHSKST